jgi:hypothetical protein
MVAIDYHLLHFFLKVAVAVHCPHILSLHFDPIITVEQLPVPEQTADQPVKVEPAFGVAVSVTVMPQA